MMLLARCFAYLLISLFDTATHTTTGSRPFRLPIYYCQYIFPMLISSSTLLRAATMFSLFDADAAALPFADAAMTLR